MRTRNETNINTNEQNNIESVFVFVFVFYLNSVYISYEFNCITKWSGKVAIMQTMMSDTLTSSRG